jgi:hypothetical protein
LVEMCRALWMRFDSESPVGFLWGAPAHLPYKVLREGEEKVAIGCCSSNNGGYEKGIAAEKEDCKTPMRCCQ